MGGRGDAKARRWTGATICALGIGVALLLAALAFAAPPAKPGQQGLEVEIEQCGDPSAAEPPAGCNTTEAPLEAEPPKPKPKPKPRPIPAPAPPPAPRAERPRPSATSASGAEHHDVDLRRGVDKVRRADGTTEEEAGRDLTVRARRGEDDEHDHADAGDDAVRPKEALDMVATDGGSPFAGFGAELVSTDEALARFAIPPFLVPIYVAAGRAYDVPWNLLASINQIETDFGRIRRQVSSAGAMGWMQFMPGTWKSYGVDASGDGVADPYNPVDAIYAAARYLRASGAPHDLRRAVFSYNHADWYVDSVLKTAGVYGALPGGLVAEAGSLAFGRFPVRGRVSYGDDFRRDRDAGRPARGLTLNARGGATAVATQAVTVRRVLLDRRLAGAFRHRSLRSRGLKRSAVAPAPPLRLVRERLGGLARALQPLARSFVRRERATRRVPLRAGDLPRGYGTSTVPGMSVVVEDAVGNRYRYSGLARLRDGVKPGARLRGGQGVGRLPSGGPAELVFSVQAAGGAAVDPRPLVDGYRLLEVADFYNAVAPLGGSPFVPASASGADAIVRGGQRALAQRVLADPGIDIYPAGREDVARGIIDRRTLGALLYLRRNGLELTVTSLRSGHSFYTAGGSVSAHSFGAAADIAAFNGQPVLGNQGPGSLTEQAIRLLMGLDGAAQPTQLISLMDFGGPSFAMSDHHDHLHVGYPFEQSLGLGRSGNALGRVTFDGTAGVLLGGGKAKAGDERSLSRRLGTIANPRVPGKVSESGVRVEAERATETDAAERVADERMPLRAAPTAAGARILDVDVPAGASGDEAYALGVVSGAARGWAEHQVALLGHRDGRWRVLATPRDARGRVANPKLTALATVGGGRGYAVGPRGALVRLRGSEPARVLPRAGRTDLRAVDARMAGGRLRGVAVGASGTTVELTGNRAARGGTGRGTSLFGVAYDGGRAVAVGERHGAPLALRRSGGGWRALPRVVRGDGRLTAVAASGGSLWVAGGIADGAALDAAPSLPLAARLDGAGWDTFCAGRPALAAVRELGERSSRAACDGTLALEPGASGAAGDVAVTAAGVVVSTPGGAQLLEDRAFRPLPAAPGTWAPATGSSRAARLALLRTGNGWAVTDGNTMARVTAAGSAATAGRADRPLSPAALTRGGLAAVAATPGGDRALAVGAKGATVGASERWAAVDAPPATVRDVAMTGQDAGWAVSTSGALLHLSNGRWSEAAAGGGDESARDVLRLGADEQPVDGLSAIAFAAPDEGYAVGAGGTVLRFDGQRWAGEGAGGAHDLHAVAAGGGRAVAVGRGGILLERGEDGWVRRAEAEALTGGRDLDAAAALPDGTLLAAGGTLLLARGPDDTQWSAAPLAPLGVEVQGLHADRAADGSLRAVVLAGPPERRSVLVGDAAGWRPLEATGLERVADADLASGALWLGGFTGGRPALVRVELGEAAQPVEQPAPAPRPAAPAQADRPERAAAAPAEAAAHAVATTLAEALS